MDTTLPLSYPRRRHRLLVALVALLLLVGQASAQVITIVGTGGAAENDGWAFNGATGTIYATDGVVSISASDVVAKLALGPLTISGTDVRVDASIIANSNTDLTFKATRNIIVKEGVTVNTNGGDLTFWADSDANRVGGVRIGNDFPNLRTELSKDVCSPTITGAAPVPVSISTMGGDITIGGGNDPLIGFAHYDNDLGRACSEFYFAVGIFAATLNAGGGDIMVRGNAGNTFDGIIWTVNIGGRYNAATTVLRTEGAGTIVVEADGSEAPANGTANNSRNSWGVNMPGTLQTGSGTITMIGKGNVARTNVRGFSIAGSVQSASGHILLQDQTPSTSSASYTGPFFNGTQFGQGTLPGSSSNITLQADKVFFGSTVRAYTSGEVVVEPYGSIFRSELIISTTDGGDIDVSASDFRVGKSSNTSNIRLQRPIAINGPIEVYGTNISITGALTAVNEDINLFARGSVTQGAAITANGLALHGPGSYALTNAGNNVVTVAGGSATSPTDAISLVDSSGGLTIGTVGSLSGITAVGDVLIETLTGDLTLASNVATTSSTATAVILNAGKSSAAGTASGGDIIVSASDVTTGALGIAKLFSGSRAASTGLLALASPSDYVRYNVDENSTSTDISASDAGTAVLFRTGLKSIAASPVTGLVADGSNASTITLLLADEPVGTDVYFLITGGNGGQLIQLASATDSDNEVTATLTSTVATTITVTVLSGSDASGPSITDSSGNPLSVTVTFVAGPASATDSRISASPTDGVVADAPDGPGTTIKVSVTDAFGNPVSGEAVYLSITDGSGATLSSGPWTSVAGVVTATLKSSVANSVTVRAYLRPSGTDVEIGDQQGVTVNFVAGPVSLSESDYSASPTDALVANGVAAFTLTVTLKDKNGNPVSGADVFLSPSDATWGVFTPTTWRSNAQGILTVSLTSTFAGTLNVGAYLGSDASGTLLGDATVSFIAGPASATVSTITANPSEGIIADGEDTSTLTVSVTDAFGNPVSGSDVYLLITDGTGAVLSSGPWVSDARGNVTATLTSTVARTATVTAYLGTDANGAVLGTASVSFLPGPAERLVVLAGAAQMAGIGELVAVPPRYQLVDINGNPVPGATITFATDPADGLVSPTNAVTDADGLVSVEAWRLGSAPGVNTLTATVVGSNPLSIRRLTANAIAGPAAPVNLVVVPRPGGDGFVLLFDPVPGAERYEFILSPSDLEWQAQDPADAGAGAPPRPLITVTGLAVGDVVEIRVRALIAPFVGPASEPAVATVRAIVAKPDAASRVVPAAGPREATRADDGSLSLTFEYEITNTLPSILANAWVRALDVPAGYEVVSVTAPEGRGSVRTFTVYPEHWLWEGVNAAPNEVLTLRVTIRVQEVE